MKKVVLVGVVIGSLILGFGCGGESGTQETTAAAQQQELSINPVLEFPSSTCYSECWRMIEAQCPGCLFYVDPCMDTDLSC